MTAYDPAAAEQGSTFIVFSIAAQATLYDTSLLPDSGLSGPHSPTSNRSTSPGLDFQWPLLPSPQPARAQAPCQTLGGLSPACPLVPSLGPCWTGGPPGVRKGQGAAGPAPGTR